MANTSNPSTLQRIDTAERRHFVIEQRRQGKTYRECAEAAIDQFGEEELPKGWDKRYACKDIGRVLDKRVGRLAEEAEQYRAETIDRLMAMMREFWRRAQWHEVEVVNDGGETVTVERPPDEDAAGVVFEVMDRLERLLGVDELEPPSGSDEETNVLDQVNQKLLDGGHE